jgi:hypothetical protein
VTLLEMNDLFDTIDEEGIIGPARGSRPAAGLSKILVFESHPHGAFLLIFALGPDCAVFEPYAPPYVRFWS